MSDDPKMLKVDDKWSVSYDAGQNDRPLAWHRYGNLHTPFSEFNADVAMFYGLKDATDRIEELEAENKRLRLEAAHANDTADVAIERAKELEDKLERAVKAFEEIKRYSPCGDSRRKAIDTLTELEAKLNRKQRKHHWPQPPDRGFLGNHFFAPTVEPTTNTVWPTTSGTMFPPMILKGQDND